ncbi:DUF2161 domain-containing phosphodiesterase [Puniceibacterium sp. IMCC21224]|uniref:DUF2161 domain-containing phosphodiesterase n=1 Tax=Puniceibacterium sp. IMCC21224 TaxID=1618204 RepID=UPI00064D739C|nr:DUF2161 family putative PD-(D/E)XK-type phosphodiesterase [Puniceibacterium sp. IMCC21224]KMK68626.1 hypothetical protein IMCC21224_113509 [Puniceibacterium sp. IMCC21224]
MKRESELYGPVKALLQRQGYEVKGEVGAADLVAIRGGEDPVIVELKLRITLTLFHQAVARQSISDLVYIAVPRPTGAQARRGLKDNLALCRRLGLGFITVREDRQVEVLCDPGPYAPRKNKAAKARLLRAYDRLRGDPNEGGATRYGIVTGYRQDSLRCAAHLAQHGPCKGAVVAKAVGVKTATRIMADNHYGWFERASKGIYDLTADGRRGLVHWAESWED